MYLQLAFLCQSFSVVFLVFKNDSSGEIVHAEKIHASTYIVVIL